MAEENIEAVVKALITAQEDDKKKRWSYTWRGKEVIFVEHLGKALKSVEKYTKVVDTAISSNPQVSGLVWAGILAIMRVRMMYSLWISIPLWLSTYRNQLVHRIGRAESRFLMFLRSWALIVLGSPNRDLVMLPVRDEAFILPEIVFGPVLGKGVLSIKEGLCQSLFCDFLLCIC